MIKISRDRLVYRMPLIYNLKRIVCRTSFIIDTAGEYTEILDKGIVINFDDCSNFHLKRSVRLKIFEKNKSINSYYFFH